MNTKFLLPVSLIFDGDDGASVARRNPHLMLELVKHAQLDARVETAVAKLPASRPAIVVLDPDIRLASGRVSEVAQRLGVKLVRCIVRVPSTDRRAAVPYTVTGGCRTVRLRVDAKTGKIVPDDVHLLETLRDELCSALPDDHPHQRLLQQRDLKISRESIMRSDSYNSHSGDDSSSPPSRMSGVAGRYSRQSSNNTGADEGSPMVAGASSSPKVAVATSARKQYSRQSSGNTGSDSAAGSAPTGTQPPLPTYVAHMASSARSTRTPNRVHDALVRHNEAMEASFGGSPPLAGQTPPRYAQHTSARASSCQTDVAVETQTTPPPDDDDGAPRDASSSAVVDDHRSSNDEAAAVASASPADEPATSSLDEPGASAGRPAEHTVAATVTVGSEDTTTTVTRGSPQLDASAARETSTLQAGVSNRAGTDASDPEPNVVEDAGGVRTTRSVFADNDDDDGAAHDGKPAAQQNCMPATCTIM